MEIFTRYEYYNFGLALTSEPLLDGAYQISLFQSSSSIWSRDIFESVDSITFFQAICNIITILCFLKTPMRRKGHFPAQHNILGEIHIVVQFSLFQSNVKVKIMKILPRLKTYKVLEIGKTEEESQGGHLFFLKSSFLGQI